MSQTRAVSDVCLSFLALQSHTNLNKKGAIYPKWGERQVKFLDHSDLGIDARTFITSQEGLYDILAIISFRVHIVKISLPLSLKGKDYFSFLHKRRPTGIVIHAAVLCCITADLNQTL